MLITEAKRKRDVYFNHVYDRSKSLSAILFIFSKYPSGLMDKPGIVGSSPTWGGRKHSGAEEICCAHNPEVDGSKPAPAKQFLFRF